MKTLGKLLIALGIIWAVVAFNLDTSVATGISGHERVNNIGLISDKNNHLMGAAFTILIGVLLLGFGSRDSSSVSALNSADSKIQYTGERDVTNASYQLFLTKKFKIERNQTLEKYVVEDEVLDTLDDALKTADARYSKELDSNSAKYTAKQDSSMIAISISMFALILFGGIYYNSSKNSNEVSMNRPEDSNFSDHVNSLEYDLEPFVVNITSDIGDKYLSASIRLKLNDLKDRKLLREYTPLVRSRLVLLLSAAKFEDISSPEGKEKLSQQILNEINSPFNKKESHKVSSITFTSFVIQ